MQHSQSTYQVKAGVIMSSETRVSPLSFRFLRSSSFVSPPPPLLFRSALSLIHPLPPSRLSNAFNVGRLHVHCLSLSSQLVRVTRGNATATHSDPHKLASSLLRSEAHLSPRVSLLSSRSHTTSAHTHSKQERQHNIIFHHPTLQLISYLTRAYLTLV